MSLSAFDLSIEISQPYDFEKEALSKIAQNVWVKNQWPLVYFIDNKSERLAYVGESTNAANRIKSHLANPAKSSTLNQISIIGSDKFNKSATLDIESNLIQYITAEGTYKLLNGNYGLINHNYYQKDLYKDLFKTIWNKLIEKKVISKSLSEIENSELFKYSPYKSLNEDQYNSVLEILDGLCNKSSNRIFVKGSAGTGKTILATYMIKLLSSDVAEDDIDDLNDAELKEVKYIRQFQTKYPKAKIGLVIAMTSLRESLRNVFQKTPGLKASMVISPSETFNQEDKYDLLIVDEAHRLRQYKNIGWMGAFNKNNQKLGLDDEGNELDWIMANSKNQIFFYDAAQSVKPSDIGEGRFTSLREQSETLEIELKSQMRVQGGSDYITFVDEILNINRTAKGLYKNDKYDLIIFETLGDLYSVLEEKELQFGLSRLVAGYSWPWLSKENESAIDIEIDSLKFQWNKTDKDWINSPNAFAEIGCIHTTQGYDLNYTGVIFGKEISYNKAKGEIEIDPKLYFDQNGKKGIADQKELKAYIINIYKTIMYRGIKGTYLYVCDENLREYLKQYIPVFEKEIPLRIIPFDQVKPYVNAVPLVDFFVAAGNFGDPQMHEYMEWVELPFSIAAKQGYFVSKVIGESMNKKIPNGSYCLFKQDEGGTRNGKIVLVQSNSIQNAEEGSAYTIKEYSSEKKAVGDEWAHESITLKPLSYNKEFRDIVLLEGDEQALRVVGIFERVLI